VMGDLVTWGVLDEGSADFLMKVDEQDAKQIVASIGPEVRNPSAFVTRKVNELVRQDAPPLPGGAGTSGVAFEALTIYHNGTSKLLQWFSKEQALATLKRWGVLDEPSAAFLMKASEELVKDIVGSLGPDVRNPSAYTTRRLKEFQRNGALPDEVPPKNQSTESMYIHHNGVPKLLHWFSAEQAIARLQGEGIIYALSADFLKKIPESMAKEIVSSLGPEVRNPSAFVTKRARELLQGEAPASAQPPRPPAISVTVYHNGVPVKIPWHSQTQALDTLVDQGILDQRSADFLQKLPETAAWEILANVGPEVRNPSAFVTREAKTFLT
jgi:hypothetical protein